MSDKLVAGAVTALAIAPVCAICVFGVAGVTSFAVWLASFVGGVDGTVAAAMAIVAGIVAFAWLRKRGGRRAGARNSSDRDSIKGTPQ